MARKRVKLKDLDKAIEEILDEYAEHFEEGLAKTVQTVAEAGRQELRATSPVHPGAYKGKRTPGRYAKGWSVKDVSKRLYPGAVIHNRTDYQLAHLLENGHALRQGGRARAIPHVAPVADKVVGKVERAVEGLAKG